MSRSASSLGRRPAPPTPRSTFDYPARVGEGTTGSVRIMDREAIHARSAHLRPGGVRLVDEKRSGDVRRVPGGMWPVRSSGSECRAGCFLRRLHPQQRIHESALFRCVTFTRGTVCTTWSLWRGALGSAPPARRSRRPPPRTPGGPNATPGTRDVPARDGAASSVAQHRAYVSPDDRYATTGATRTAARPQRRLGAAGPICYITWLIGSA